MTVLKKLDGTIVFADRTMSEVASAIATAIRGGLDLTSLDLGAFDLRNVDFSNQSLQGANFENADLRGADLSMADVRCGSFAGARIDGTTRMKGIFLSGGELEGIYLGNKLRAEA